MKGCPLPQERVGRCPSSWQANPSPVEVLPDGAFCLPGALRPRPQSAVTSGSGVWLWTALSALHLESPASVTGPPETPDTQTLLWAFPWLAPCMWSCWQEE